MAGRLRELAKSDTRELASTPKTDEKAQAKAS